MAFEELYLVSTRVAPLDGAAVDALLAECEIDPPGGYREFLTRFGLGEVRRRARGRAARLPATVRRGGGQVTPEPVAPADRGRLPAAAGGVPPTWSGAQAARPATW